MRLGMSHMNNIVSTNRVCKFNCDRIFPNKFKNLELPKAPCAEFFEV